MNLQNLTTTERCDGGVHRWRSFVGDPVPMSAWDGMRCYCGRATLRLHRCECGHEHIKQVSV